MWILAFKVTNLRDGANIGKCPFRESWKIMLTPSVLASTFSLCWYDNLLKQFSTQIRIDKTSVLIWILTVWHSDSIPEKKK